MNKYVCTICGYIYDEALGDAKSNTPAGTHWDNLPDDWKCPLCSAPKSLFKLVADSESKESKSSPQETADLPEEINYSEAEISAIFSNLAKGWEKQYNSEAANLCRELSSYFKEKTVPEEKADLEKLNSLIDNDLNDLFSKANEVSIEQNDRGAQRSLKWAEQVTYMSSSHLMNFAKDQDLFLEDKNIYVCEICGFIYVGDEKPEICPVCKVPNMKLTKIERGA